MSIPSGLLPRPPPVASSCGLLPWRAFLGKEQVHRWDSVHSWGFSSHVFPQNWGEMEHSVQGPRAKMKTRSWTVSRGSQAARRTEQDILGAGGGHTPPQPHSFFPDRHRDNSNSYNQKLFYGGFPLYQAPLGALYIILILAPETRSRTRRSATRPADAVAYGTTEIQAQAV